MNIVHFIAVLIIGTAQIFFPTDIAASIIILISMLVWVFSMPAAVNEFTRVGNRRQLLVFPLVVFVIIGFTGSSSHETRDILRDFAFVFGIISVALLGVASATSRVRFKIVFGAILVAALFHSIKQVYFFVENPELLSMGAVEIRESIGTGVSSIVGLSMLLFYYNKNLFPNVFYLFVFGRYLILFIFLAAFMLSFSRTQFLVVLFFYLSLSGYLTQLRARSILLLIVALLIFTGISIITPEDETGTLSAKIVRSFTEVSITDTNDFQEINDNWRGYETGRALEQYLNNDLVGLIFGGGFGATVDVGLEILLGDEYIRHIPVIHNGYMYVLLKTGLAGLVMYILFFYGFVNKIWGFLNDRLAFRRENSRIVLGCIFCILLETYIVHGVFQFSGVYLIFIISYISTALLVGHEEY